MRRESQEIEAVKAGHEARNAALRRVFLEKGTDLGETRLIECHFWARTELDAENLARSLKSLGFRILVMSPAASEYDPSRWSIEAGINQTIELTMRPEFTDEVVRLASSHSAEYDGWGTSI